MPSVSSRPQRARVGVLCYDLSPSSLSILTTMAKLNGHFAIKAYPLFGPVPEGPFEFEYRASSKKPRTIFFNNTRGTSPENQISTLGFRIAWQIVSESDAVILLGIQGFPALLAAGLASLSRKPLIVVSQTMGPAPETNRPWPLRRIKALALKAATHHIAQTPKTVETLKAVYRVPEEKITYIGYDGGAKQFRRIISAVSPDEPRALRREMALPPEAKIILFCGTLIYLKGIDILIKAIARIQAHDQESFLLIAGRDGDRHGALGELKRLSVSLGVASKVKFLGELPWDRLARVYASSDIFVLPTRKDTWGKVLVEAGLAGLPVVTTEICGGAGHLVQDGINGYVIPVDDVDALAEALTKLGDPGLRKAFGEASLTIMSKYLDSFHEEDLFREVLERCLGSKTRTENP